MQGCTRCSMPCRRLAREAEQLDAIAQLLGEADVDRGDVADALDMDAGEIDLGAEGDAGQDGELVRGVDAVDVEVGSASA